MWEELYVTPREEDLDRDLWSSVKAMWTEVRKWIWWWLGSILAGVLALGLEITGQLPLPRNTWLGLIAFGFLIAPSAAFHFMRVDRDRFKVLWENKRVLMQKLRDLEDIRAKAAALHIRGKKLKTADYKDWKDDVDEWLESAIKIATAIHPAEGGTLETIGIFYPELTVGTKTLNKDHQLEMLMLVQRLKLLVEIRNRWSGC